MSPATAGAAPTSSAGLQVPPPLGPPVLAQGGAPAGESVAVFSPPVDQTKPLPVVSVGDELISPLAGPRPVRRLGTRREYGRTVRGAMLTPWFAVSVGIVIAISLTVATSHPALTFPPSTSGRCVTAGCASPSATPAAPAPAIKHEFRLPGPTQDANVRAANVKVEYRLLPDRHDGGFMAVIVVLSSHRLGDWQLRFSLPGASIRHIMWAKWRHDGRHGVLISGSPPPWRRSDDNEARIVILGTGTPRWPTGCKFDGGKCVFRALTDGIAQHFDLIHIAD